jgi:hypothetical protein
MEKRKTTKKPKRRVAGILGLGLDGEDGHKRITRTPEMVIVGGSEETHGKMQDTAIYFAESLEKRGKTLAEAGVKEVRDLLLAARDRAR